jgi:hypothetical protein
VVARERDTVARCFGNWVIPGLGSLGYEISTSMWKTSGRYHSIFLNTELASGGTPLAHYTALLLIGHIQSGQIIRCLTNGYEEINFFRTRHVLISAMASIKNSISKNYIF